MSEFPKLRQLATLSPLPGFRTWLETQITQQQARDPVSCCAHGCIARICRRLARPQ